MRFIDLTMEKIFTELCTRDSREQDGTSPSTTSQYNTIESSLKPTKKPA